MIISFFEDMIINPIDRYDLSSPFFCHLKIFVHGLAWKMAFLVICFCADISICDWLSDDHVKQVQQSIPLSQVSSSRERLVHGTHVSASPS